jgi:3-deoxy-D-manno-octulosonate 8-phosphate phosphatase KdsC-like HAD superfamily phosphatase
VEVGSPAAARAAPSPSTCRARHPPEPSKNAPNILVVDDDVTHLACAQELIEEENDRELLERCGLGVAVADAVDELKAVADRVLELPDGEGAAALLRELARAARGEASR